MKKIRKGDEIIVITGKDKGKTGKISRVVNDGAKVVVDGINLVKKHVRPNPNLNEVGGIKEKAMPIDISNVAIYNTETKKADRVGFKIENGKKVRVLKSTGKLVD
jgi:large subunit ribosomal protein L24